MQFTTESNASGLLRPMPILRTRRSLAAMAGGQALRVVCTAPGAARDRQALAAKTGISLPGQPSENNKFIFYLRKA